jgi:hypothetical protein
MRQRRSSSATSHATVVLTALFGRHPSSLAGALVLLAAAGPARGQNSSTSDGALFLLLPIGAHAVGMGQAMVAEHAGSEGVWWNPSSIARQSKREIAIHHSQTIAATGDAISYVHPIRRLGSVAISIDILNFDEQQITDPGGTPIGVFLPRNIVLAGTYGAAIGRRLSAGATYKLIQYRVDCSGQCSNVSTFSATSSAADLGAQYEVSSRTPLTIGIAVRNVGTRLRVSDTDPADDLPTRLEAGGSYVLPYISRIVAETEVRVAGAVVTTRTFDEPAVRLGAEMTYQKNVHLRAGYVARDADGAAAALGFGLGSGRLVFDIARTFGGLSADSGETPTYFSLRYLF